MQRRSRATLAAVLSGVAMAALLLACGGKTTTTGAPPPPPARGQTPASADGGIPQTKVSEFTDNDFVESDRNRDPMRSFARTFVDQARRPTARQLSVMLSEFGLDELKLVAIVMSGDYPRVMVLDPAGKGWVLKRGDFVGRAETVHVGGATGTDYLVNWRVDRIRGEDVVFIREDPAQPAVPPATRVVPLHAESDKKR